MPEGERWKIRTQREGERERRQAERHCLSFPNVLVLTGSSLYQRTDFLPFTCWLGQWDLPPQVQTPLSTHSRSWPRSHSEVQRGGTQTFLPFLRNSPWAFSSCPFLCEALGQFSKTIQRGGQCTAPKLPRLPGSRVLVNNGIQKGAETQNEAGCFRPCQQISSCKECEMFPKEIPPSPGSRGKETEKSLTHFRRWE